MFISKIQTNIQNITMQSTQTSLIYSDRITQSDQTLQTQSYHNCKQSLHTRGDHAGVSQQLDHDQMPKNDQSTEGEQKIWRLFDSLDCSSCQKMYNNRQRKPHIICPNNHLVCKSCYSKYRQSSPCCPFCGVRMQTKPTSSHESIQLFLKIYNQICDKQKTIIQQKRKRTYLEFQIPKNLKTLVVLLLIIVMPWIYDGLKIIVCWIVDFEYRCVIFLVEQVSELFEVVKTIVEDEFFIGLYTNEHGEYVYHGEEVLKLSLEQHSISPHNSTFASACSKLLTHKHKVKIETYMGMLSLFSYLWTRITKAGRIFYEILRVFSYCTHFIMLVFGLVQLPFLIPFILARLELLFPRKSSYRMSLYLDIIEPWEIHDGESQIEPKQIERLSKFELYFFLCVRNYIQSVLKTYRAVEADMKKRCEELQEKRRMRHLNKKESHNTSKASKNTPSSTANKVKTKFSFERLA